MKAKTGDKVRFGNTYEGIVLGHRNTGELLVLRTDKSGGGWEIIDGVERIIFVHVNSTRLDVNEKEEAKRIIKHLGMKRGWLVLEGQATVIGRWDDCEITGNPMVIGEL